MLANVARIVVVAIALVVLFLTPLFVTSPSGTSIEPVGAIVDAIALIAVVLVARSWLTSRSRA